MKNKKKMEKLIEKRKFLDLSFERLLLRIEEDKGRAYSSAKSLKNQLLLIINLYNELDFQILNSDLGFFFKKIYHENG